MFQRLTPHMVPQGSILVSFTFYVIVVKAFAENSRSTSLQRVALRRVVSLLSCYFLQKPKMKWVGQDLTRPLPGYAPCFQHPLLSSLHMLLQYILASVRAGMAVSLCVER